ncbi:hypothetical protein F7734_35205 [Scytonema sp. UIC 10036]|uniref:hypothetical protein n=1 Tax=Scytonema sp. UIC 10036 TaxID=2304196 RepID=UPI0012DA1BEE|nr:hypothetical protein [Scytonema sp. UIC 10036]MUG97298.1 hypothetical protein [Scytonema sp. UIC 10036]
MSLESEEMMVFDSGLLRYLATQLNAYGGRVKLGGLAEPGIVALSIDDNKFSLSFPSQSTRANVSLTNGRVIINSSDRTFNNRVAQFGTRVGTIDAASGLFVLSQGSGIAGDIEVISPQIRLDNTGTINATSASGNGGNIKKIIKTIS